MKRNLAYVSSLVLVVSYLALTLLSLSRFPDLFSPLRNWLSDLGNPELNPGGAVLYNTGILLTGAAMAFFFVGLGIWKLQGHKAQNVMLLLTQACGCLGALAMVLSGVFPISTPQLHSFWSAALYILTGTAFAFAVATLRYYRGVSKWLLIAGGFVVIEDLFWSLVLNIYPMEWLTVFLFLGFILLLGLETKRSTLLTNNKSASIVSMGVNHV
jgi:hypothetical membrane protein